MADLLQADELKAREDVLTPRFAQPPQTNHFSPEVALIAQIRTDLLSYSNYLLDKGEREREEIVQRAWAIYNSQGGRKVVDYLLDHEAATVYTLTLETHVPKATVLYVLSSLEGLNAVHVPESVREKRVLRTAKNPKGAGVPPPVYALRGVDAEAVSRAILTHMKLKNPEAIKRLEREAEAEREAQRQQREEELEAARRDEELAIVYQSTLSKFLERVTTKTVDYPEIDAYLSTVSVTDDERKNLRYRLRDSLKDMGRWR